MIVIKMANRTLETADTTEAPIWRVLVIKTLLETDPQKAFI